MAELTGIEAMLNLAQLRWSGHVSRMDDSRLPKQLFHAELSTGKRHKGGQRKQYKDVLKSTLKAYNIPVDEWQALAQDWPAWRAAIRNSPGAQGVFASIKGPQNHSLDFHKRTTWDTFLARVDILKPGSKGDICSFVRTAPTQNRAKKLGVGGNEN